MSAPRITVSLARPVTVEGVRHDALHLRPMKRRDLSELRPGFDGEVGVALTARLAGVPVTVIYALTDDDAERVGNVASALLDQVL